MYEGTLFLCTYSLLWAMIIHHSSIDWLYLVFSPECEVDKIFLWFHHGLFFLSFSLYSTGSQFDQEAILSHKNQTVANVDCFLWDQPKYYGTRLSAFRKLLLRHIFPGKTGMTPVNICSENKSWSIFKTEAKAPRRLFINTPRWNGERLNPS